MLTVKVKTNPYSRLCFYSSFIFYSFGLPLFLFFLYPRARPLWIPWSDFLILVSPISSFLAPFQVPWLLSKAPLFEAILCLSNLPLSRVLPGSTPILSLHSLIHSCWPSGALPTGICWRNIHHPKTESHPSFILTIRK